jgi:S-formylglutathione hydrolase FrmB
MPPGNYQVMVLLDTNHSFAYAGVGPGCIVSPVVPLHNFQPDDGGPLSLPLTARVPDEPLRENENLRLAVLRSDSLSAFMGRTVEMRAGVFLPPSYASSGTRKYPTVFYIHGFAGSFADMWKAGPDFSGPVPAQMYDEMRSNRWPEMIYVYLDATCPQGHHAFVDSVNNGPWETALVQEFIPYLEQTFRMAGTPATRFLTGHSSGGWSALWLQVTQPDFFGGVWATSPDPVDFRNWLGPNLARLPPDNFYFKADGGPRWLMRIGSRDVVKNQEFAQWEAVLGDYGGQLASFEAAFSPRGNDGRPMRLFNRDTGAIDPLVEQAWEKYDLSRKLKDHWTELAPKLKGKLHLTVGSSDTIRIEEPVALLRDRLQNLGSDAKFSFLEGHDHFNVYDHGLAEKMAVEMSGTNTPPR